jgi:hypothetical protein
MELTWNGSAARGKWLCFALAVLLSAQCHAMTFLQCEHHGVGTRVKYYYDKDSNRSRLCSIFDVKRFPNNDIGLYGEVILNPADEQPFGSVTIQWFTKDENNYQISFVRSGKKYRKKINPRAVNGTLRNENLAVGDKLRVIPKAKREPDTNPRSRTSLLNIRHKPLPDPVYAIVTKVHKELIQEEGQAARWEYHYIVNTVEENYTPNSHFRGVIEAGLNLKEEFNLWEKVPKSKCSGSSSGANNSTCTDIIDKSSGVSDKNCQEEQTFENFKRQVLDDPTSFEPNIQLDTFYRKNGDEWEEVEITRYCPIFDDFSFSYNGDTEQYNKEQIENMTWTLKDPQQEEEKSTLNMRLRRLLMQ